MPLKSKPRYTSYMSLFFLNFLSGYAIRISKDVKQVVHTKGLKNKVSIQGFQSKLICLTSGYFFT